MAKKRRTYTREFKLEAIQLAETSDKSIAEIERDLFNHFLAAQLADGSNWSYMTPLNGRAQQPFGPNCCNAAGSSDALAVTRSRSRASPNCSPSRLTASVSPSVYIFWQESNTTTTIFH